LAVVGLGLLLHADRWWQRRRAAEATFKALSKTGERPADEEADEEAEASDAVESDLAEAA
jgi:hypothetical protein